MSMELVSLHGCAHCHNISKKPQTVPSSCYINAPNNSRGQSTLHNPGKLMRRSSLKLGMRSKTGSHRKSLTVSATAAGVPLPPLDLTEENVKQVLVDDREEFGQIFDAEVGITGQVDLAELDGPFAKIRLKGRFWHKRSAVLARVGNYLKQRIPEILEVDIEDDKQLDDSPENF